MSTETDWREAARGIPVWEGAAMLWRDLASEWDAEPRWREDRAEAVDPDGRVLYGDNNYVPADRAIPNLADPGTRAAYDRRLALALGAPGEEADRGAVAYVHEDYGCASLVVDAGPGVRGFTWSRSVRVGDSGPGHFDPLLARALAWPTDKRVAA